MTDVADSFDEPGDEPETKELPPLPQATNQLDSLQQEAADEAAREDPEAEGPFIEHRDTKWHVVEDLPGAVTLDISRLQDQTLPNYRRSSIVLDVIQYGIVEDERAAFMTWLKESQPTIDMNEVMEVLQKVVEAVVNRPSQ